MQITQGYYDPQPLIDLYQRTFTASDGADEGAVIGDLVKHLLSDTAAQDIHVLQGQIDGAPIAAAIFTRLTFPDDPHHVVILSPMAVAPDHQRKGHGQALLRQALDALAKDGVQVAITYGDPAYYGQVGFAPLTTDQAQPPLPLSMPIGWIGQPLKEATMPTLIGPSRCVRALNRPEIW
ncbi:GNAT family N-acetyltransferase [Pseudooceanicola sp. MF1-13]|uniref:GNAT family N-acetyltransferase n=1 Tax=Pseudooceanicola sp. MF1-13 TaxID=3379095 RepID=UPI003891BAB8